MTIRLLVFWNKLGELLSINSLRKNKLQFLSPRNSCFNIFEGPRSVSPKAYAEFLAAYLATAFEVMTGSGTVLRNNIMKAIDANKGKPPTIEQVCHQISNDKDANPESRRRLIERFLSLQKGVAGKIFGNSNSISIEEIVYRNVGFALEELSAWQKNVLLISQLCSLIQLKKNHVIDVRSLVMIDDMPELISVAAGSFESEKNPSLIEKISMEYARECRINIIASTQTPFSLNKHLLDNVSKFISFRVGVNSRDLVAKQLNLDKDKSKYLGELERGYFLAYSAANFPKAVYAQTPLLNLPEIPMSEYQKYAFADEEVNEERATDETNINLSREEQVLLVFLKHNWWCTVSEIADKLGWPISKVSLLMKELVDKGMIKGDSYATGKGSGNVRIHYLTAMSMKTYGEMNIAGKGSLEHCFWQKRAALYFESMGYKTKIEYFLPSGESVDVLAEKDGLRTAVEINLSKVQRELSNIAKLKDFPSIIWSTRSEVTLNHMQTLVNSQLPELKHKILFMLLKSFLYTKEEVSNE